MRLIRLIVLIALSFVFASSNMISLATQDTIARRDISVTFDYKKIDDGFGNVRKLMLGGTVQNSSHRIASRVSISFKFVWKDRASDVKKLEFTNLAVDETQEFEFEFELGTQPASLHSITCNIDQIKFTNTREPSPLTPQNMVVHELYSLDRLNEEGKSFLAILKFIKKNSPFRIPLKDEFETTSEHEARVNQAENEHFSKIMFELENRYGQLLGGTNSVIRFLPRAFRKNIVYLSECSAYFQVPVQFGPYNADKKQFERVTMNPRTFPFPLETVVPEADFQFMHKAGIFFLRKTEYSIDRTEAKNWRDQGQYLLLEATVRFGVVQDGPYFKDLSVIEKLILRHPDSGKIYREWLISN